MIDKKFLELIHKDIDKEITPSEKELLNEYLKENPEADILHRDLLQTEAALNQLPERVPSENIKKNILNSIDLDKYAPKKKKLFTAFNFLPKRGLILSFSLGIIAGIIILSIIFAPELTKLSDEQNVYGTIGLSDAVLVEAVPVKTDNVSGKIVILKNSSSYGFYVELDSDEEYAFQLQYNPRDLELKDFSARSKNVLLEREDGLIRISSNDHHLYTLLLSRRISSAEEFTLKLVKDGNSAFEREISVRE